MAYGTKRYFSSDALSIPGRPLSGCLVASQPRLDDPSAGCVAGHSRQNGFLLGLLELDRKSIVFHLQTIAFIVFLSISREPFWLGAFSPGVVETLFIFWNGFFI